MKINELLLDVHNPLLCGDLTIGAMVAGSGEESLWSMRSSTNIDVIVIHYISACESYPSAPFKLEHVLPIFPTFGVSAHYLINRRGALYRLVPEQYKAWHCGGSIMPAPDTRTAVNDFSIGIELLATQTSGFTDKQYNALCRICIKIEQLYGCKPTYVGHDQIAGKRAVAMGLRKDCKVDPGPLFQWKRFAREIARMRTQNVLPVAKMHANNHF